jgi:uncharacterized protein (DUF885 family)
MLLLAAMLAALTPLGHAASYTAEQVAAESAKANALFERSFQDSVDRNPLLQAQLGIKKDSDKWQDLSDARAAEDLARSLGYLAELKRTVRPDALDPQTQLSYRLFVDTIERRVHAFPFRLYNYPVNQNGGIHTSVPTTLANLHPIDNRKDAEAYVARLRGIGPLFDQVIENLQARREHGIVPPRWVFPRVTEAARGVVTGAPFDEGGKDSPIWADFTKKVAALKDLSGADKKTLLDAGRAALRETVKPAYGKLIAYWTELEQVATNDDGAWKFPNGEAYYNMDLADTTTTALTADQIHQIGLSEVARLHEEMKALLPRVNFSAAPGASSAQTLQAFFKFMREEPRFYLPNTPESREKYLALANAKIDDMRGRLDQLFITKPKAALVVKATEPYREKTASKAFYQRGAPDGSRPGVFYATLYDMHEMPTYQIDAIVYHEGIPGHHMQISIAQELQGTPNFRKNGFYGAYTEGWGLYCERLPKEIGLYQDPYADFGRLAMELWRAVRLVVDTGIHAKRWTRQQAIDYFLANTPQSEGEVVREIERYIVNPAQATSYKIGMLKILELRELAKKELGAAFDIREFHEVILKDGALPLNILEENVRAWIARKKS